jgi:hypothetical protein
MPFLALVVVQCDWFRLVKTGRKEYRVQAVAEKRTRLIVCWELRLGLIVDCEGLINLDDAIADGIEGEIGDGMEVEFSHKVGAMSFGGLDT